MNLALTNMTKNGLSVLASFIIGFDQEMKGAGERICRFVEENNIPLVMLNTLHALPNTSLWERLKREGRLLEERVSGDFLAVQLNYIPSRPESEIMQEYLDAVDRLYEPSAFLRRVYQHFLAMRATREALGLETAKNAATAGRSDHEPISLKFKEILSLMRVIWRQGVLARYRWQFWRQLVGIRRKNPSRMRRYLISCVLGENLFSIREIIARGGSNRQGKADETRDGKADLALPGS
jgi:radical SAM superfamily enzyme YgiQ (UPF0313 family)